MATVTIDNARKRFGAVEVLHGVSIDIEDGEFVALVGPSGCGKSTLLRLLAGLEKLSSGSITIGGEMVNDLAPRDRNIAMVFQSYALYPHKTVVGNLEFSLKVRGMPADERARRVARAAEILDLEPLLKRYPRQLSGGQRQRVAMGRAIVRDPALFLFDEPLSNLDAQLRIHVRGQIKELHERLKTTMIYVTHDQIEALSLADKVVVMRGGRIEQMGPPLELYDHPANMFVAGFIGSPPMNFLPGKVNESGDGILVGDTKVDLRIADVKALPAGGEVMVGIRPEHLAIASDGVPAEVSLVEPTGSDMQITARIGAHQVTILARERLRVTRGDKVSLRWDPSDVHIFAKDTGLRFNMAERSPSAPLP